MIGLESIKTEINTGGLIVAPKGQFVCNNIQYNNNNNAKKKTMTINTDHVVILYPNRDGVCRILIGGNNRDGQLGTGDTRNRDLRIIELQDTQRLLKVSHGIHHCAAINNDGNLYTWGEGKCGKLGYAVGIGGIRPGPTLVPETFFDSLPLKDVCVGMAFTLVLDVQGNLWFIGFILGQIINNPMIPRKMSLPNSKKAIKIDCGYRHVLVLDSDSNVWSLGSNSNFQLGIGYRRGGSILEKLEEIPHIMDIVCGAESNLLLDREGGVWGFGANNECQLGICGDGSPVAWPEKLSLEKPCKRIWCGSNHGFIEDLEDNLFGFGANCYGKLGFGDETNVEIPSKLPFSVNNLFTARDFTLFVINHNLYLAGDVSYMESILGTGYEKSIHGLFDTGIAWYNDVQSKVKSARK